MIQSYGTANYFNFTTVARIVHPDGLGRWFLSPYSEIRVKVTQYCFARPPVTLFSDCTLTPCLTNQSKSTAPRLLPSWRERERALSTRAEDARPKEVASLSGKRGLRERIAAIFPKPLYRAPAGGQRRNSRAIIQHAATHRRHRGTSYGSLQWACGECAAPNPKQRNRLPRTDVKVLQLDTLASRITVELPEVDGNLRLNATINLNWVVRVGAGYYVVVEDGTTINLCPKSEFYSCILNRLDLFFITIENGSQSLADRHFKNMILYLYSCVSILNPSDLCWGLEPAAKQTNITRLFPPALMVDLAHTFCIEDDTPSNVSFVVLARWHLKNRHSGLGLKASRAGVGLNFQHKDTALMPSVVTVLQEHKFHVGPVLTHRVAAESDDQSDCEQDDINDFPTPDPWDTRSHTLAPITAVPRPHPRRDAQWVKPTNAPHLCWTKRHAKEFLDTGHVPPAATARAHITLAAPLATNLASSTLPAALSVYAAKVIDGVEQHGSKVPRSLTNLLGLGFRFFKGNGMCILFPLRRLLSLNLLLTPSMPRPLLDGRGRIITVLASRPAGENYHVATLAAFYSIRNAGTEAQFPTSMHKHCHGLFTAITPGAKAEAYGIHMPYTHVVCMRG
ncbi:hypothetical protein K438DRAFT_1784426 [Mycena galopus ATCC 62051]|nr:hypothetical protein K438DRAFT_1784426 [Mycena galopus ATCC 62051]